jgi:phage terminase large subunit
MQNPKEVFSLSRKQKKCKKPQGLYRRILNVEFAGRELCQCITVENPNGLYLMNNYIVTHNSNGGGKALGLSTLLPTPNGYMTMKESRVGDWIYGEDGKPTRIIWESGILENRPCYKITFSSGEQVVADGEHLWKTLDERERGLNHRRKERIRKKRNPGYNYKTLSSGSIKTTQELFHTVRYMGRANHSIACCEPIKNSKKELPIEPYLNGRSRNRYILDIQKIPSEPVKCIQIGNPDGMFLITKSFIPTHNSDGLRSVNMVLCTEKKNKPIKTLIFRRKSNDLLENHIVPFFQRYPELKKFFNKTERIIYWMDGSTTKFGSSDNEDDIQDFEGKEYDYIFVDEATHCTQYMLEYLKTRNRSGNVQAKCIYSMIPGFIGHLYIKRIFITKKYLDYEDPSDYVYLPARVWDNVVWVEDLLHYQGITVSQYYNEWTEDQRKEYTLLYSDYAKTLSHLPEQKRRARLYGDWFVFEGQFFENFNYDVHVVKKENYLSYEELANFQQAGGLDYGNVTSIQCVARDHNGNFILFDELHQEKMVRQEKIKETKEFLKKRELEKMILVGDTNMWIKDGFDVDVTSTPAYDYITAGLKLVKVSKTSPVKNKGYREACNDLINDLIFYEMEPDNPSKFKTKPKLLVYERCVHFLETFPSLIIDPKNPEDIEDGQSDHDFDSAKMVIMYLRTPIKKQEKNVPEWVKEMQQAKKIKLDGFMSV